MSWRDRFLLPCGWERCPLCPPQRLDGIPAAKVKVLPKAPDPAKKKKARFVGVRYTRRIGQIREDFSEI